MNQKVKLQMDGERLARLETKVELLLDLLKEIKEDLKDSISKEEFAELKAELLIMQKELDEIRISLGEKAQRDELSPLYEKFEKQTKLTIAVGVVSGILGFVGGLLIKIFLG